MKKAFAHSPEAIADTVGLAERCNVELSFGESHFPIFPVPEGETLDSLFEKVRPGRAGRAAERHAGDRPAHPGD